MKSPQGKLGLAPSSPQKSCSPVRPVRSLGASLGSATRQPGFDQTSPLSRSGSTGLPLTISPACASRLATASVTSPSPTHLSKQRHSLASWQTHAVGSGDHTLGLDSMSPRAQDNGDLDAGSPTHTPRHDTTATATSNADTAADLQQAEDMLRGLSFSGNAGSAAAMVAQMPDSRRATGALPTAAELATAWSGFKGLLGGVVTCVTAFPAVMQAMRSGGVIGSVSGDTLALPPYMDALIAQAMADEDAAQLVAYMRSDDADLVQGSLVVMMDYLQTKRLTVATLLRADIISVLSDLLATQGSLDTTALALEALACVLTAWGDKPSPAEDERMNAVVGPLLSVMHMCLGSPATQPLQRLPTAPAFVELPPDADAAAAAAAALSNTEERYRAWGDGYSRSPRSGGSGTAATAGAAADAAAATAAPAVEEPDATDAAAVAQQQQRVNIAFFTACVATRLAQFPATGRLLVRGYALPLLCAGLNARDACVRQVCLLALDKLVHVGSHADNLVAVLHAGAAHALRALMCAEPPPRVAAAATARGYAAAAAAGAGDGVPMGWSAVVPGAGSDALVSTATLLKVRDMAAALLLDIALLPEAPAHAADNDLVVSLVQLLDPAVDSSTRMYALLILARLANHSLPVQLDAVREGAVPFLVCMMQTGNEDECLHAARLTAILAQSPPTHEPLRTHNTTAALLPLVDSPNPLVVEHACSVFAIMANNPDTHFHIVGDGVVPKLIALLEGCPSKTRLPPPTPLPGSQPLGASSAKAKTYILAMLLCLCMHERRHADVICRSGAIRHLVNLVHCWNLPTRKAKAAPQVAAVREYAAAVLCCLCRDADMQMEVMYGAALPCLVQLLGDGTVAGQAHAAEALVLLASVHAHRKQILVRINDILPHVQQLIHAQAATARYWGVALLKLLCQDAQVMEDVCDRPAFLTTVVTLLENQDPNQTPEDRKAQVQGAWLMAAVATQRPDRIRALTNQSDLIRALILMLAAAGESVSRGAGGALHVPILGGGVGGGPLGLGPASYPPRGDRGDVGGAGETVPVSPRSQSARSRSLRVEPLDTNAQAAAVAALLALARCDEEMREKIEREVIFQDVWCGRQVRLDGLNAPVEV